MIPVALRSEDPRLIETVRGVLAVSSIPLAVFPESSGDPVEAGLALDAGTGSPEWRARARRYARVALRSADSPEHGVIVLPRAADELLGLARAANRVSRARVIGVVGAAGGVGASVFAAVLARVGAEEGLTTALVEGAGSPAMGGLLDMTYSPGLRWPDIPVSGIDPEHLVSSLPRWHGVRILAGDDRPVPGLTGSGGALAALTHLHDLVVIDLQRQDIADGMTQRWCDLVLVVTTPALPAVSAARALCAMLATERVHLVLRGPSRAGLSPLEVENVVGQGVLTTMRTERSLPGGLDRGLTPGDHRRGPLMRAARATLDAVGVLEA